MKRGLRLGQSARRKGFTLAEMLVVMAIILVLVAILFPVYLGAKEMGFASRCVTNLHQLQIAVDTYTSEIQRFPPATSTSWRDVVGIYHHDKGWVSWWHVSPDDPNNAVRSLDTPPYSWSSGDGAGIAVANITNGVLWSRVGKELRVYYCPTFARQQRKAAAQYRDVIRSYSMNTNIHAQLGRNLFDTSILPSQAILFMDEQMGTTDVKKDPVCTTNEMGKFHRYQRGHAVYVDGHVEKMQ